MNVALLAAAAVLVATPVLAGGLVSVQRPETATTGKLSVTSSAFKGGQPIPVKYSAFGQSISPQLSWSLSTKAKSYAVLVDDPDGSGPQPVSHWVAWNIPADVTMLPEGSNTGVQGTNSHKGKGYVGPHPPAKDPPHHYHFQVLALDTMLNTPAGAERDAVLAAAKGHVVAKGEIVGTFQAPKS
ncbi:MAG TPA: YbhB/YbcL family Raf kinase inhibitor-like protein [Phenylobacterium sp.]|jgi:Raf kinase inhibitor-like YbhB/YbcL family protein|uniref:YbhB/YbcL family Raf kinase inhibitor-like protein n=1 Tax=Phenylobacterium sp. TaxID=1871053 RepID=UPI002D494DA0|nr:YbhB/YbcL family Raf kinase inhibitor-like protein [Phenylobacterium sp.]HZZ67114.1 YbhB/YbcL family Raf kinase inhibitor-like protein [Phenylobacterium sp.]